MADFDLVSVFDDCVNRMAAGESINECLRLYPQYAQKLRPMLETGQLVRRIQPPSSEAQAALERQRAYIYQALTASVPRYPVRQLTALAASLVIVFFGAIFTLHAAAESLPSDPLYGLKRLTENIQQMLSPNDPALIRQFETRRLDEITQLLKQQRAADVEFKGIVEAVSDQLWLVAGLPVQITPDTIGEDQAQVGSRITVAGFTTLTGELIARSIVPAPVDDEDDDETSLNTATPTVSPTPTVRASSTPTATLTATITPSPTPTVTASLTSTPTRRPTLTATATPTQTLTPTRRPTQRPSPTPMIPTPTPEQEDDGGQHSDDGSQDSGGSGGGGGSSGGGSGGDDSTEDDEDNDDDQDEDEDD